MQKEAVIKFLQFALAKGALEKGGTWGGPECAEAVPLQVHIVESSVIVGICMLIFFALNFPAQYRKLSKTIKADLAANPISSKERLFELIFGTVHILMFLQILYYKWNIFSLVNMIQPCHLILLLQGVALLSTDLTGVLLTSFMLPALTGTLLAMLFPETVGLDQPLEMEAYWLQHYLIQSMPLYLLLRRNSVALRNTTLATGCVGLWILAFSHFSIYEIIDVGLSVNVEFMLCPTGAMDVIFPHLPSWMLLPSYRTTLTVMVCIVGTFITWFYLQTATILRALLKGKPKAL